MNEPMESSGIRRGTRRPLAPVVVEAEVEAEATTINESVSMLGYEAVEVAANALITAAVRTNPKVGEDLAHTGAVRTAVVLLHGIALHPSKAKNYKELRKLLDTLSLYHRV